MQFILKKPIVLVLKGYPFRQSFPTALTNNAGVAEIYASDEKGDEPKTMSEVLDRVENKGRKAGQMEIAKLMNFLLTNGRSEDAIRATNDESFLNKLLSDFNRGLMAAK